MPKRNEILIEQLISFETAKLAKSKGFNDNGIVWLFYEESGRMFNYLEDSGEKDYVCCTQELLRKWLREKHHLNVWAKPFMEGKKKMYLGYVDFVSNRKDGKYIAHESQEEAIEYALQTALKKI
jgi:hypothetical protein